MGILNVTPDSFSDGGLYLSHDDAVRRGIWLADQGADIIDVGGESTRPGAHRTTESDELDRVVTVVGDLARAGLPVTIDTMRSSVAEAAVLAGAVGVNDVSGGLADPEMARFVAEARIPYIVTHWRSASEHMTKHAVYHDVVRDVFTELRRRLEALERAGVDLDLVVVDPGLGFAKTAKHNWQLLNQVRSLTGLGRPILIGASRKSFLKTAAWTEAHAPALEEMDAATAAVSALAAASGVFCVRVHVAKTSAQAVRIGAAWATGGTGDPAE